MSIQDLEFTHKLADAADKISMARFGAMDLKIETKPDLTPVSDADRSVEEELRKLIANYSPQDSIIGEEFGHDGGGNREWILDPIDGTKNFVRGVPFWGTLIGLRVDGEMTTGMVSAPALGRRWFGAMGLGSFLQTKTNSFQSERKLQVSKVSKLEDAYLGYSSQDRWEKKSQEEEFEKLLKKVWRARGFGDFIIHMMVAEGSLDLAMEPSLAIWDMAALIPIIREAGGNVTSLNNGDPLIEKSLVTTNGLLHEQTIRLFS
ncbi:MAG: inositol monophosphatase family protein [Actinomycetes bacterium]|jgi:histidinol-phosphatase